MCIRDRAKAGRAHILGEMNKALTGARTEVSKHAPRIETMQIDKSKIRDVIGTGGKVIREIVAETGAKVDIDDEGVIKISSSNADEIEAARCLFTLAAASSTLNLSSSGTSSKHVHGTSPSSCQRAMDLRARTAHAHTHASAQR